MPDSPAVTKEWEAFGNKELVFTQHLYALDMSQENLAKMIALRGTNKKNDILDAQISFITYFIKTLFKAQIKIEKYNREDDIKFSKQLSDVISNLVLGGIDESMFPDFILILFKVGLLYDKLGYNSPERLRVKSTMQSDLQVQGMEEPEYSEPMTSGYET